MRFFALFIILFASCTYRYENCTINCNEKGEACKLEKINTDSLKSTQLDQVEHENIQHDSVFMENY